MNKIIEILGGALSIITGVLSIIAMILFFVATPIGIFHAFKEHNALAGGLSLFLPPVAWYFAAESFFWHDEYANVDWEKRLENDVKTTFVLIGGEQNLAPSEVLDFGIAKEKFSERVSKYPTDKKDYLQKAARIYIDYNKFFTEDIISSITNLYITNEKIEFVKSEKTKELENKLQSYAGVEDLIEMLDLYMKRMEDQINDTDLSNLSSDEKKQILDDAKLSSKNQNKMMEDAYDFIFDNNT